jgi:hypothetical protein
VWDVRGQEGHIEYLSPSTMSPAEYFLGDHSVLGLEFSKLVRMGEPGTTKGPRALSVRYWGYYLTRLPRSINAKPMPQRWFG